MLAPANEARIFRILTELTAIPADEIKRTDRLREDLGMDSVASMELLSAMAEELDLDVGVEDVADVKTVQAVVDLARRFLAAKVA